jgi:hypothetical protein
MILLVSVASLIPWLWRTSAVSWEAKFVGPSALFVLSWFLFGAASHLPREFPVEAFEDLTRLVVKLNQKKLVQEAGGSTIGQAWLAFRELVSDASGIPAPSITREMLFPDCLRPA